jgi:hypothetical protein
MAQQKPKKPKTINVPEDYLLDTEEQLAHLLVTKVDSIIYLLECSNVDSDKSLVGSEPFYKPVLNEEESYIVKKKLLELISQF